MSSIKTTFLLPLPTFQPLTPKRVTGRAGGATHEEHSHRKHTILREYFFDYLTVRCQSPHQSRFRLAIIDGFAGGGCYRCGTPGSPLIFLEELQRAIAFVNTRRATQGFGTVEIECLLVLNDEDPAAVEILKKNVAPLQAALTQTVPTLHLHIEYLTQPFEHAYRMVQGLLSAGRYRNVLFNLDQCGHRDVHRRTLVDIMHSYPSVEVFYTFAIQALIAFLRKSDPERLAAQLAHLDLNHTDLENLEGVMHKQTWLGHRRALDADAGELRAGAGAARPDGCGTAYAGAARMSAARGVRLTVAPKAA